MTAVVVVLLVPGHIYIQPVQFKLKMRQSRRGAERNKNDGHDGGGASTYLSTYANSSPNTSRLLWMKAKWRSPATIVIISTRYSSSELLLKFFSKKFHSYLPPPTTKQQRFNWILLLTFPPAQPLRLFTQVDTPTIDICQPTSGIVGSIISLKIHKADTVSDSDSRSLY